MQNYILYSGLITFLLLSGTTLLRALKKKPRWHQKLAYSTYAIAIIHAGLVLYRTIRLYFLY